MSFKDELLGDTAPSRAPYQDFGRFRVVVNQQAKSVWIYDSEDGGAGNRYEIDDVETAIGQFIDRRF